MTRVLVSLPLGEGTAHYPNAQSDDLTACDGAALRPLRFRDRISAYVNVGHNARGASRQVSLCPRDRIANARVRGLSRGCRRERLRPAAPVTPFESEPAEVSSNRWSIPCAAKSSSRPAPGVTVGVSPRRSVENLHRRGPTLSAARRLCRQGTPQKRPSYVRRLTLMK
jgi:hypothetical protein